MNNVSLIKGCTGCGACACICPQKAITIDGDYFYIANVDNDKCIYCGKCLSVCPVKNVKPGNEPIKAVGGWASQSEDRKRSSSGGAFTILAEYVLSQDGVVFGAKFSDDCKKVLFDSTDHVSLDLLRRSKYVESFTGDSFKEVFEELSDGRLVLYCGTPCQIAGLKSFIGKDYDNLILCDFACGGLPSHKIYSDYIDYLEKNTNLM